jgi:hypothetical protein
MNPTSKRQLLLSALGLLAAVTIFSQALLIAQVPWPSAPADTPQTQRNSLKTVQAQVKWLQNATRTAPNYASGGADNLWQQFQMVRGAYNAFKATLTPRQLDYGANDLAELDAGLDIIQGTFSEYQDDLAGGRSGDSALRGLCQILNQTIGLWLQELNKTCARLRAGWP